MATIEPFQSGSDSTNSPHPRRRIARTLWGLTLSVLLLISVVLGLSITRRMMAIRAIEQFNGAVHYQRPGNSRYVQLWLGEERMVWVGDPDVVIFQPNASNIARRSRSGGTAPELIGAVVDDDDLDCVLALPNIRWINLSFSGIGDAGVKKLAGLSKLEYLNLEGTDVTDASIPVFLSMRSLRWLHVENSKMTRSAYLILEGGGIGVSGPHNNQSENQTRSANENTRSGDAEDEAEVIADDEGHPGQNGPNEAVVP